MKLITKLAGIIGVPTWVIPLAFFALVLLGWGVYDQLNDRQAINRDRAAVAAKMNEELLKVEREAAVAKAKRDTEAAIVKQNQMEAINEAIADPNGDPLGAVFNRM